jgi:hypothetical protein
MNIFKYLKEDGASIAKRLEETCENYSEWTMDRVFEETKRDLDAINSHFQKTSLLVNNLKKAKAIDGILAEEKDRQDVIKMDIDNLVMIHVDEPGFEQALETIRDKFENYLEFCEKVLFLALEERLSKMDRKRVAEQLAAS